MTLILAYTPPGSPGGHPTLAEAVADLRQDLFDCTQGIGPADAALGTPPPPPRWRDDALARALDRAVDEYSFVAPLVRSVMTATLPGVRAYGLPADAWWIESVEYPSALYPPRLVPFEEVVTPGLGAPAAPLAAASGLAGPLAGSYVWSVTFVKSGGETLPGPASAPLTLSGAAAALSALPLGPPGTVGRHIYRATVTAAAGGPVTGMPRLAGQVLDNTTTLWADAVPDGLLGAAAPGTDTTANLPQFVLRLAPGRVPTDTSGVLTVTYAAKHSLTPAGTSLPERHHDVVLLGAAAYAMLAYQAPTNDLFEYQDGELHDRVDEHTVPAAWLAAATAMLARFTAKLDEIKRQNNAGIAAVARWGDVPVAWQRT